MQLGDIKKMAPATSGGGGGAGWVVGSGPPGRGYFGQVEVTSENTLDGRPEVVR